MTQVFRMLIFIAFESETAKVKEIKKTSLFVDNTMRE